MAQGNDKDHDETSSIIFTDFGDDISTNISLVEFFNRSWNGDQPDNQLETGDTTKNRPVNEEIAKEQNESREETVTDYMFEEISKLKIDMDDKIKVIKQNYKADCDTIRKKYQNGADDPTLMQSQFIQKLQNTQKLKTESETRKIGAEHRKKKYKFTTSEHVPSFSSYEENKRFVEEGLLEIKKSDFLNRCDPDDDFDISLKEGGDKMPVTTEPDTSSHSERNQDNSEITKKLDKVKAMQNQHAKYNTRELSVTLKDLIHALNEKPDNEAALLEVDSLTRLSIVAGELWIPDKSVINIYSLEKAEEKVHSIEFNPLTIDDNGDDTECFTVHKVQQVNDSTVFVATNQGLFVANLQGDILERLESGNFTDVDTNGWHVIAVTGFADITSEYQLEVSIYIYVPLGPIWLQTQKQRVKFDVSKKNVEKIQVLRMKKLDWILSKSKATMTVNKQLVHIVMSKFGILLYNIDTQSVENVPFEINCKVDLMAVEFNNCCPNFRVCCLDNQGTVVYYHGCDEMLWSVDANGSHNPLELRVQDVLMYDGQVCIMCKSSQNKYKSEIKKLQMLTQ